MDYKLCVCVFEKSAICPVSTGSNYLTNQNTGNKAEKEYLLSRVGKALLFYNTIPFLFFLR